MTQINSISSIIDKINRQNVNEEGINNVISVLKSGFLSKPEGGPYVHLLQSQMSKLLGQKFCFSTSSGTASLHAAIASLKLKRNDEVLIPALTYIADASVVIQEHAKPIFVDIAKEDFNMDPKDVLKKITKNTRAIIVVHLYGQPAKMDELMAIAKKYKLVLIEDCAQAAGAKYKDKLVGSFGDISCFSFYQTKHIVCGEGGLVATSNKKYANVLKSILNNGIKRENLEEYDYDNIGFNYQMTELQAALAVSQLKRLDSLNEIRRKHVATYKKILSETDIYFQQEDQKTFNAYCYLTCLLPERLKDKREQFIKLVLKAQIPIKKQYPIILPETEVLKKLMGKDLAYVPVAKDISKRLFNLYVNPGLETEDINYFARKILALYKELK